MNIQSKEEIDHSYLYSLSKDELIQHIINQENEAANLKAQSQKYLNQFYKSISKDREDKFQKIIEFSEDGITFTDTNGRIIEWNHGLERITKLKRKEVLGKYIWDVHASILPIEPNTMQIQNLKRKQEISEGLKLGIYGYNDRSEEYEVEIEGERKVLQTSSFVIKTKEGNMHGSITRDITDLENTTKQLKQQNTILQELNDEKDNLMSVVAHDLKAPLNKVLGLMSLLQMEGDLNENQTKCLTVVHDVVQNGINLIRDLLDINAYEYQGSKPKIKEVNLNALIENIVRSYQENAIQKNILLHYESLNKISIETDAGFVVRIVDNLLSNAIKFSPKGKNIYVNLDKSDRLIRISVKDEGQGIAPEEMQFLFKKFQTLSTKPTAGESSTGLGLAIIKKLAEMLKGKIEVQSELGSGSEFVVYLPLSY